jgi:hypothetical protein
MPCKIETDFLSFGGRPGRSQANGVLSPEIIPLPAVKPDGPKFSNRLLFKFDRANSAGFCLSVRGLSRDDNPTHS